jgi:hypothetical protein
MLLTMRETTTKHKGEKMVKVGVTEMYQANDLDISIYKNNNGVVEHIVINDLFIPLHIFNEIVNAISGKPKEVVMAEMADKHWNANKFSNSSLLHAVKALREEYEKVFGVRIGLKEAVDLIKKAQAKAEETPF